jgi:uncharacterized protein (UPF0332 family)
MLGRWPDEAGRAAYLAGFHAAQALIDARTSRTIKSHRGVNAEFHRLIRGDARIDDEMRAFLGRTYQLKTVADYEAGPGAGVSPATAADAIEKAKSFVAKVAELIEETEQGAG